MIGLISVLAKTPQSDFDSDVAYDVAGLMGIHDSICISPSVFCLLSCCGSSCPYGCVSFVIAIDWGDDGFNYDIYYGAYTSGSLFNQNAVRDENSGWDSICLSSEETYKLLRNKIIQKKN